MPPHAFALETPLREIPGVGPARAAQLAKLDLFTVNDLLLQRPRRYEDRRHVRSIRELDAAEAASTRGRIVAQGTKRFQKGAKSVFEFVLDDGTARLHCRWWNLPFMENYFNVGDEVMVFGKLRTMKPRTMDHPETEILEAGEEPSIHLDRIAPIYPLTEGLSQRWLRSLVWRVLEQSSTLLRESDGRARPPGLPDRVEAVQRLHFPEELKEAESSRERLAFDEFLDLQLSIQRRRQNLQSHGHALPCVGDRNRLIKPFLARLEFRLNEAQLRVLRELRHDLGGTLPMRRLLQGDVGSGKTVVAACCALMAVESGCDVALMAPTEILAEQHYATFNRWLKPLGVGVELRTGSRTIANPPGTPRVFVGTHALIEAGFSAGRLGLVVIDEQHKFGVAQREKLVRKGHYPHLLVMTATPIPRTLGLTVYGDLDISVIDQLPAGRGGIRTFLRSPAQLPKVRKFIREKLAEGRQAYVVYPRVEDGDLPAGVKAVTDEFEQLRAEFAPFQVGLLHGRLTGEAKESVMSAFRNNRVQILLATSVIEVGVDVPNATVMLVESADQFGLAQLHQLRGRVGRGAHESYCILVADPKTEPARERLRVLASTQDGFAIAEADLRLRGPGELLGQDQSGLPRFRFGNLATDLKLVEQAREFARQSLRAAARP